MNKRIKLTNAVLVSLTCKPYHFEFKYPAGVVSCDARELIGVGAAGKGSSTVWAKLCSVFLCSSILRLSKSRMISGWTAMHLQNADRRVTRAKVSAVKKFKRPADVSAPEAPMSSDASVA